MENILLEIQTVCPSCHAPVSAVENFCPKHEKKLKEEPISTKKFQ